MNLESSRKFKNFVEYVAQNCSTCPKGKGKQDTGYRAIMRRADNPNLESIAWEHLVAWCDIENPYLRKSFALVGAAIARMDSPEKAPQGKATVGKALQSLCNGKDAMEAKEREGRRLQRLIACDSTLELLRVLRPVLQYLQSKGCETLDYAGLLQDICYWDERKRIKWIKDFYLESEEDQKEA